MPQPRSISQGKGGKSYGKKKKKKKKIPKLLAKIWYGLTVHIRF